MVHELNIRIGDNPIRHNLLPELLCWLNSNIDSEHYEILFNSISDGQYKVVIINKITYEMVPIRASDAILLSKIANIDIYMEEKLFVKPFLTFLMLMHLKEVQPYFSPTHKEHFVF